MSPNLSDFGTASHYKTYQANQMSVFWHYSRAYQVFGIRIGKTKHNLYSDQTGLYDIIKDKMKLAISCLLAELVLWKSLAFDKSVLFYCYFCRAGKREKKGSWALPDDQAITYRKLFRRYSKKLILRKIYRNKWVSHLTLSAKMQQYLKL